MRKTKALRVLCALLMLLTAWGALSAAPAEVVITISDSTGSSISQNSELAGGQTDAPADAANDAPAGAASDAPVGAANDASAGAAGAANDAAEAPAPAEGDSAARAQFIEDILALAQKEYDAANGKARRAQYSGDIYVCKNFTVYLFRENADKYRMAEYPDASLVIPDNLPKDECIEYVYGAEWKNVAASDGNPFVAAATFRYNAELSKEENREAAREFLKQVKRGDYFQMAANYYYGVGAHSMVFTADYDPDTDTVHWTDSNMKGEKRNGIRYGYVQFNAEKKIDWFVDAFCRKKYGATIYRLREDIVYAQ